MRAIAARAGRPPPLSAPPSTAYLDEIERLSGNAQLLELYERSNDLTREMSVWGTREHPIMLSYTSTPTRRSTTGQQSSPACVPTCGARG